MKQEEREGEMHVYHTHTHSQYIAEKGHTNCTKTRRDLDGEDQIDHSVITHTYNIRTQYRSAVYSD